MSIRVKSRGLLPSTRPRRIYILCFHLIILIFFLLTLSANVSFAFTNANAENELMNSFGRNKNLNDMKSTEQKLIEKLLKNYNKKFRPPGTIEVKFAVNLNQIVNLLEKDQIIVLNAFVDHEWQDQRLVWDPAEHNNITMIRISGDQLWTPDTFIYTTADQSGFLLPQAGAYFVVRSEGIIFWPNPLTQMKLRCRMNIVWFPFDDQLCVIVFGSWSYTSSYLNYTLMNAEPTLSNYTEHNEFVIIQYKPFRSEIKFDNWIENDVFSEIRYKILIRRKPLFVIQNCVFPAIMLCILTLVSFFIPFAQEMQIGISIMLAFSVFKLRLSDDVPVQSDSIPLINIYFTLCMSFSLTAMIWFSVINKLKEFKTVPRIIRYLVVNYVFILMCIDVNKKLDHMRREKLAEHSIKSKRFSSAAVSLASHRHEGKKSSDKKFPTTRSTELLSRVNSPILGKKSNAHQGLTSNNNHNTNTSLSSLTSRTAKSNVNGNLDLVSPNESTKQGENSDEVYDNTTSNNELINKATISLSNTSIDKPYAIHKKRSSMKNTNAGANNNKKVLNKLASVTTSPHSQLDYQSQSDYDLDEPKNDKTKKISINTLNVITNYGNYDNYNSLLLKNNNSSYIDSETNDDYSPYPVWVSQKSQAETKKTPDDRDMANLPIFHSPSLARKERMQLALGQNHNCIDEESTSVCIDKLPFNGNGHNRRLFSTTSADIVQGTRIQINRERSLEPQSTSIPIKNHYNNPLGSLELGLSDVSAAHLPFQQRPALPTKRTSTIGNGTGTGTKTSIVTDVDDDELELSNIEVMIKDIDIINTLNQFVFILFLAFCLVLNIFGLYFAPYYVKRPLSIDED